MSWDRWDCLQIRKQLPLWVGGDLPEFEKRMLDLHLRECSDCRSRADALRESHQVVMHAVDVDFAETDSLWPDLKSQLAIPPSASHRRSFFATGRLAAAALVIIGVGAVVASLPIGDGPTVRPEPRALSGAELDPAMFSSPALPVDPPWYLSFPQPSSRGIYAKPLGDDTRYKLRTGIPVGHTLEF